MPARRAPAKPSSDDLRRLLQRFIRDFGLLAQNQTPCGKPLQTSHAHALMALLDENRQLNQKDLARELGLDKSSIARLCQRMEQEGHIEQLRSDGDARVRHLRLTARGAKLAREIEQSSKQRFAAVLDAVPAAERARLFSGLELLAQAVRTVRGDGVE